MTGDATLPANAALLLDMDGTLIEFAATPDAVIVPPELPQVLRILRARCDNALAIVTGRPIEQIDGLLGEIPYAVAGEHGGAIRHAPGASVERVALPAIPAAWLGEAERLVAGHPGSLLERKAHNFVVHFRRAPSSGPALRSALDEMIAGHTDDFAIMTAKLAWEVKALGADKGTAVTAIMARPPFQGRVPVYIGDDVTDEYGIQAAQSLGGLGWRVHDMFTDPAGVRAWLLRQAAE